MLIGGRHEPPIFLISDSLTIQTNQPDDNQIANKLEKKAKISTTTKTFYKKFETSIEVCN